MISALVCAILLPIVLGIPIQPNRANIPATPTGRYFFKYLDTNGDQRLNAAELLSNFGKQHDTEAASKVMEKVDKDKSGFIEFAEFQHLIKDPIDGAVQQVHLALTTQPSEMVVMWVTKDLYQTPAVQYGTSSGSYTNVQNGTYTTYDVGVDGWDGWIYKTILAGLQPATQYYYICGSEDNWSSEYSFVTAPQVPVSPSSTYVHAIVADMGTVIPVGWAVTDQIVNDFQSIPFSMVLHAGDVCYAGTGSTWEVEEIWDVWENQVQPLAANIPYMFAVGNHEHYYNYTSYRTRFQMPGDECGGNGNFWYSIDFGNTHFTFMSTEHDYTPGSPQYNWIVQDLAQANSRRDQVPWLIVSGHRPMYCSDTSEWNSHSPGAPFQTIIEPLFDKYNVDLYLCGHMHMYERIFPVNNGTVIQSGNIYVNPGATAHVVQATAGVFTDSDFVNPQPAWSAMRNGYWGYGRMTVNGTHLHYEFYHQEDYSLTDEFWILKK